ncbi:MAG: LysR family transcriptional regulator [Caulobacteraceae bacterium]
MTLRHLVVFVCVCDTGSMTAAAERLYMSQPSVSQAVSELERYYNIRLFERLGRKLYITEAGKRMLTYAHHIIHLYREAENEMKEVGNNGTIRVGASVTVGTCILSEIIKKFLGQHSGVKIIPTVDNTKVIEQMLLLDQADLGLVEGTVHSKDLVAEPFMEDELVLICSTDHEWAKRDWVEMHELAGQEFFVREEGSGTRELFESVMVSNNINWSISGVYNNSETIKNSVAAGLGISVISRMSVKNELRSEKLSLVKINGLRFGRHFSIVYHKNKFITPVMQYLIELCQGIGAAGN